MSLETFQEAAEQAYRGFVNGEELYVATTGTVDWIRFFAWRQETNRNYFPNPNLKPSGTMVEVRRNLALNPLGVQSGDQTEYLARYGWARSYTTGITNHPLGIATAVRLTATGNGTGTGRGFDTYGNADTAAGTNTGARACTPGATLRVSGWHRANFDNRVIMRVRFINRSVDPPEYTSASVSTQMVSAPANTWVEAPFEGVVPANATHFVAHLHQNDTATYVANETWIEQTGVMVTENSPGPFFAPGLPSPDADLEPAWTGTPNASASVLRGQAVAGLTTVRCAAIRSSKFGGSLRLISLGASAYAYFAVPTALAASCTFMATAHTEAPLSGSLDQYRMRIVATDPVQASPAVPNEAGSYPQRLVVSSLVTPRWAHLRHGGGVGSGDVYWTNVGLFAGDYTGPWFSGDEPPGPDTETEWAGEPDKSESILYEWLE